MVPIQLGKFHLVSNALLMTSQLLSDEGALTYSLPNVNQIASQVSIIIFDTVEHPKRKANDRETYINVYY